MKHTLIISVIIITGFLFSCSNKNTEEVKVEAETFLQAMRKPVDFKKIKAIYPNMTFYSVWRVDNYKILSVKEQDENIIVDVSSYFVKKNNEKFTNDFLLKFQKLNGKWLIVNTKGITSINKTDCIYAVDNGFVTADNTWDIELTTAIKTAVKERGKKN